MKMKCVLRCCLVPRGSIVQKWYVHQISNDTFLSQLDETFGNLNGHVDTMELVESEMKSADVPQAPRTSRRTLVVHRLLVFFAMILILAVGIIVNVILTGLVT